MDHGAVFHPSSTGHPPSIHCQSTANPHGCSPSNPQGTTPTVRPGCSAVARTSDGGSTVPGPRSQGGSLGGSRSALPGVRVTAHPPPPGRSRPNGGGASRRSLTPVELLCCNSPTSCGPGMQGGSRTTTSCVLLSRRTAVRRTAVRRPAPTGDRYHHRSTRASRPGLRHLAVTAPTRSLEPPKEHPWPSPRTPPPRPPEHR